MMKIDLHAHTCHSDGTFTPTALVEEAVRRGVGIQALTDHDTMGGVPEALEAGARRGVRVLWGVEFSARDVVGDVHVLGFFRSEPPASFRDLLARQRTRRVERATAMMERLKGLGKIITWDDMKAAGASEDSVGRPHVARALVARGYAVTVGEAFRRWISPGGPAYVAHQAPSPEEAIGLIREAGGVTVAAHPGKLKDPLILDRMIAAGLQGLEVFHPDHTPEKREGFVRLAREKGLIATGGADFHGLPGDRFAKLGDHSTPPEEFVRIEALWKA